MAWKWTAPKAKAAQLVAEDEMTDAEIAAEVSTSIANLYLWKKEPEFQARVHDIITTLQKRLERYSIARKDRRIAVLDGLLDDAESAIEARKRVYGATGAPGGETGFVSEAMTASGKKYYTADTSLSAEIRALSMQAAKEMGQLTEKREQTFAGKDGQPVDPIDLIRAMWKTPFPNG